MTVKVEIEIPNFTELDIKVGSVVGKAATKAATKLRQQIRRGQDAAGSALPKPEGGGKPLRDTGQLLKSIKRGKIRRGRTVISARGMRDDGKPNQLVMGAQQKRIGQQVMGLQPQNQAEVTAAAEKEIRRQLARSRTGGAKSRGSKNLRSGGR